MRVLSESAGQFAKQIRFRGVGVGLHHRAMGLFRLSEPIAAGNPADNRCRGGPGEPLDRLRIFVNAAAVEKNTGQARAVPIEIVHPFENIIGRVDGHELFRRNDNHGIGKAFSERNGETAADHIAQHIVHHDIEVLRGAQSQAFKQGKSAENPPPRAPHPRLRPTGLGADHTAIPRVQQILQALSGGRRLAHVIQCGHDRATGQEQSG